ncbi:MAG: hypothetical protein GY832_30470, partial [Chloroflexi bacterium]|nr:hypothetical protein [Chloroflexota bacterium]
MRRSIYFTIFWTVILLPMMVLAEGSAELDAYDIGASDYDDQQLQASTELYVDIVDSANDKICWVGRGDLTVNQPDKSTEVAVLTGDDCTNAANSVTGAYYLELERNQRNHTEWDIRVCSDVSDANCLNVDDNEILGRLWADNWYFYNDGYDEEFAVNGSVYAVVPGGAVGRDAVIEMRMEGVSGYEYWLNANTIGPETSGGDRIGRSIVIAGNTVVPLYRLYLNPPDTAQYNWITPDVTNVVLSSDCGADDLIVTGSSDGTITFNSNITGTYVVVCDVNKDTFYDFGDSTDFSSFGDATDGDVNTVVWNGADNDGTIAGPGDYNCIVRLNVGEFHYIARDIETAYPGIRMFRVESDKSTRTPIMMFWDDNSVQLDLEMDFVGSGEYSPFSAPPDGLDPESYATASDAYYMDTDDVAQTGNARAWGRWIANGKGEDNYVDTFSAADTDISPPFVITIIAGGSDTDGDGLSNSEECDTTNTDPQNPDTDGDGVDDNTDDDPLDENVCADGDGDSCDDCANTGADGSGGNTDDDGLDTDGDGDCNDGDTDDDNDGVPDGEDDNPLDANDCDDTDGDGCNDCAITGADGSGGDPDNDGTDTDGDGICNDGDPDDDNDGVADGDDDDSLNPNDCRDVDTDGCDDCINTGPDNSGGDTDNDGLDTDGDGLCNGGDPDDDNDGVADGDDDDSLNPNDCRDVDTDGCDDCINTGANNSGGDTDNDGLDTDGDGLCNGGDPDDDNDGVADGDDDDSLNPNDCRDVDTDGCDDCINTGANNSG